MKVLLELVVELEVIIFADHGTLVQLQQVADLAQVGVKVEVVIGDCSALLGDVVFVLSRSISDLDMSLSVMEDIKKLVF